MSDPKAQAEAKRKFDLHVNLIMHQDAVAKAKAQFIAWQEGPSGLDKRLGRPQLPLDGGK